MASVHLSVREGRAAELVAVVRAGLAALADTGLISPQTRAGLAAWCDETEEYALDWAGEGRERLAALLAAARAGGGGEV